MKGIDLCRLYYNEFGKNMLERDFPELMPKIAVGICGGGSECFGFDDDISVDHDFEPGFAVFIPDEIDEKTEFRLERAYAHLPKEYMGFSRSPVPPRDGPRRGVIRTSDFLRAKTGTSDGKPDARAWLCLPDFSLAEAVNGQIFYDGNGYFTSVRRYLCDIPRDVTVKKLVGNLFIMGQSGQYNYERCLKHGENGGAQLALFNFTKAAINAVFALNKRYAPYYKWSFRAMRELDVLGGITDSLEYLITTDNSDNFATKMAVIDDISTVLCQKLRENGYSDLDGNDLVPQAYNVNEKTADPGIRDLHVLYAIND